MPRDYVDLGNFFQLHPRPDEDYDIYMRCTVYAPDLEDDAAESLFVHKDRIIIAYATSELFMMLMETSDAEYWDQAASRLMIEAASAEPKGKDWVREGLGFHITPTHVYDPTNPFETCR